MEKKPKKESGDQEENQDTVDYAKSDEAEFARHEANENAGERKS